MKCIVNGLDATGVRIVTYSLVLIFAQIADKILEVKCLFNTPPMTKEQLIKEFREKFKHSQFVNYSAIEAFLLSAFDAGRASGIEEVKEEINHLIDHTHCFNQETPPCGKKAHARCCLCEAVNKKD